MQVHLFSSLEEGYDSQVFNTCREVLSKQSNPILAYLPAASLNNEWDDSTWSAFRVIAQVVHLNPDQMTMSELKAWLDRAAALYIPGGNTYFLAQRLHKHELVETISLAVAERLPLVAFSAGTVFTGPNILTTNDMNVCGTITFGGLALTQYNFNVHYPQEDGDDRVIRDGRLHEYHFFNQNPIIAMEDGAYLRIMDTQVEVVRGKCWLFEKGSSRKPLDLGQVTVHTD